MDFKAYHGTNHRIKKFSDEFAGRVGAADAEGPGIYTTNSKENAAMWGKNIYEITLSPRKVITNTKPANKANRQDLKKFLDMISDEDYANNWSPDIETDKLMAINEAIKYSTTEDEVWHSLRKEQYNGAPQAFMRAISKLGYDMMVLFKKGFKFSDVDKVYHYIVFNPEIITVNDVEIGDDKLSEIRKIIRKTISEQLEEASERQLGTKLSDKIGSKFVVIYRAVANGVNEFKEKDYVTPIKRFAVEHAENNHIYYEEPYQVIQALVSTENLYDASNPGEYFYSGKDKKGKVIYITKGNDYEGYEELTDKDFIK